MLVSGNKKALPKQGFLEQGWALFRNGADPLELDPAIGFETRYQFLGFLVALAFLHRLSRSPAARSGPRRFHAATLTVRPGGPPAAPPSAHLGPSYSPATRSPPPQPQ